jgi:hypothetical protein
LSEIRGETFMSNTAFKVEMKDGNSFEFATNGSIAFFEMPDGYSGENCRRITPWERGIGIQSYLDAVDGKRIHRNRPYFHCFVPRVDFGEYVKGNVP